MLALFNACSTMLVCVNTNFVVRIFLIFSQNVNKIA